MSLINKEKLESEMYHNAFEIDTDLQKWDSGCWIRYKMFENVIEEQPEVKAIPLDKPFCKMVYGDYVVYNKKWLVNQLQTEWNILQGKEYKPAIPVEWIDGYIKRRANDVNIYAEILFISDMVKEWEAENEKSNN